MTLKLTLDTKELKNALAATDAIGKKAPGDMSSGDALMAMLRKSTGWTLVTVRDYFASEVSLPGVSVLSDDAGVVSEWDETSGDGLAYSNFIGLPAPGELQSLLTKLGTCKDFELAVSADSAKIKVSAGTDKSYTIDRSDPKKITASYKHIQADTPVATLDADQFMWFCSTVTSLGKMVMPSASAPGYGNVVISAFPSIGKPMLLSANSNSLGYSIIHKSVAAANADFAALLPKNLAEAMSSFITKLGPPDGNVDVSCNMTPESIVTELVFTSDTFSLSLACMSNVKFPFGSIYGALDASSSPYCAYQMKKDSLKKTVERLSIFAKDDDATTNVKMLDGGSIEMVQHKRMLSREVTARELLSDGTIDAFPKDLSDVATVVKTKVLRAALSSLPDKKNITFGICKPQKGPVGRLVMLGDDGFSDIAVILLGVRGAVA